jgi:hypothetical protein
MHYLPLIGINLAVKEIMNTTQPESVSVEAFYFLFGGKFASFLAHLYIVAFWG